jgi:hypothetical protein
METRASMAKKRPTSVLPSPPWSYAPSEVAEWQTSVAGPRQRAESVSRKQLRVRTFIGRCPTSMEGKLRRRLAALRFEPSEPGRNLPRGLGRFARATGPDVFLGKMGAIRIHGRLRKGEVLEVRATFSPHVPFRRASRLISRLGLRDVDGTWK